MTNVSKVYGNDYPPYDPMLFIACIFLLGAISGAILTVHLIQVMNESYPAIELGCGDVLDFRFEVRLDIQRTPAVTHVADITKRLPFNDNTFVFAKSAAVIEHITPEQQIDAVREIHRILVPNGLFWIQTPDLGWLKQAVRSGEISQEWYETQLRGGRRDEYDEHKGLLDVEEMARLLEKNGFHILWMEGGDKAGGSIDVCAEADK